MPSPPRSSPLLTRRQLLRAGAGLAGTGAAALALPPDLRSALAAPARCAGLSDIEHVVILIQENRSFDHYFGRYRGVRGFADRTAPLLANGLPVFYQPDEGNTSNPPKGYLLPFHLDSSNPLTASGSGACTEDVSHSWGNQHLYWDGGLMDRFAEVHLRADAPYGAAAMGYYDRRDLPYYYALADAFTLCDGYHCSVLGPTDPNRLHAMTATLDPTGAHGGPVLSNPGRNGYGSLSWTTYPEQLEALGISWKQYSDAEVEYATDSNVLLLFRQYQDPSSPLYQKGVLPKFPTDFVADALSGRLPQVSWIQASDASGEHPPAPPPFGQDLVSQILTVLTARPDVWAKTVFFVTWDENGGFFDHVVPPTPPPGTAGEYLTVSGASPAGPVGLGFRVPLLVLSPFSRGGLVSSDTFDHTSLLRFLETRFGAEVPNLSAWRRAAVGDLTSALNLAAPDSSTPALPPSPARDPAAAAECVSNGAILQLIATQPPPYPVPNPQSLPGQERGHARRPSGVCAGATTQAAPRPVTAAGGAPAGAADVAAAGHLPGAAAAGRATAPDVLPLRTSSVAVPVTGTAGATAVAATLVGAAIALRMRRRQGP